MNKKHIFVGIIGIIVSIFFIYLTLHNIDFSIVYASLKNVIILFIVFGLLSNLLDVLIRAYKWYIVLDKKVELKDSFNSLFLGYSTNTLLPFKIGEFLRSYDIRDKISIRESLGYLVVERVIEGLSLISIFIFAIYFSKLNTNLNYVLLSSLVLFLIISLIILVIIVKKELIFKFLSIFKSQYLIESASKFTLSFDRLKDYKYTLNLIFVSYMMWIVNSFYFYFVSLAFGFNIGYMSILVLVCLSSLVLFVPSSSGAIGVLEYTIISFLVLFNINVNVALAYAVVIRLILYINAVIVFIFYLKR